MKNPTPQILLLLFTLCIFPNISFSQVKKAGLDIRESLLASAKKADKTFPDDKDVLLTHFAYLGALKTTEGKIFVVNMRSVLKGMSAPHGVNYIMFFNQRHRFLGKLNYASSMPLWCEGGKVYLFGDLDGISNPGEGNVIDLSNGFKKMKIYHAKKYGSSGGIDEG
ncbi:MAG: hypothetical protein AB1757_15070 [Acidobacteriota bacterium]